MNDQQALREYALRKDAQAFRVLVEQYQRLVYSAASRRLGDTHDIEDVVQLTFLKLAKAAGTIRRDLASWLYSTAINSANDLIRRDQTRQRHEKLAAEVESMMDDPDREEWNKLSRIIDDVILELPEPDRSLVVQHFLRGRSQRDLAEEMNVSQPTVMRRIGAAVEELRARLAKLGYTSASPALISVLEKIPQSAVPPNVTAGLAKIGLSGAPASAATTMSLIKGAVLLKLGIGALVLAGLLIGTYIVITTPAPRAIGAGSTAASTMPAAVPVDPNDWRAAFNQAYALAPGQNLKFIPPPPLPERQRYLHETEQNDTPMPFIQWRWINGRIKEEDMIAAGPRGANLYAVIGACAKLDQYHLAMVGIPDINCDGDWIVRDGAGADAILADLRAILTDHFKLDVRSEKNEVIKDALIVSGRYRLHRIPGATVGDLQIYADVLDHPKPGESIQGGGTTPPAEFWTTMGDIVGTPIVDESTSEPRKIDWELSRSIENATSDPARRQQILDNIAKQTGLTFKQEKRPFATWKLSKIGGDATPSTKTAVLASPSTNISRGLSAADYELSKSRMEKLALVLNNYQKQHGQFPPDLATLPLFTDGQSDDCFQTPADERQTKVPSVMTADWVNQHTSFVYLAANVSMDKLIAARPTVSIILLHTKLDQPFTDPEFGNVILTTSISGHTGRALVADAPAWIASSLKYLDAARVPLGIPSTQP